MRIVSSQVQAQSQHVFERDEQRLSVRQPAPPPTRIAQRPEAALNSAPCENGEAGGDLETSLLKALVEAMTGRQIDTLQVEQTNAAAQQSSAASPTPIQRNNARTLRIDLTRIDEFELTEVAFSGQFSTEDGRSISLNLSYSMQRTYSATTLNASISGGAPQDPLVLNFDGLGAALDAGGTRFDLNSDNVADALPTLRAGSAYLALDRNDDGIINNGSELFGTLSGNGYEELARLDSDGNGFIDDGDPLFARLQLFRPGEAAQTLADRDVGAIFLGSVGSPARLTDANNQSLGQLRATGFYLTNAGTAGLVQQIDLIA